MIRLSNNRTLEYVVASEALGFDGNGWPWERPLRWLGLLDSSLFTVVAKTVTLKPRQGNLRWYDPLRCVRFIPDGVVNAVGLSNPGFDRWLRDVNPRTRRLKVRLIASIHGRADELADMAFRLNGLDLVAIEINVSCPNVGDGDLPDTEAVVEMCSAIKSASNLPIILKLSVAQDVDATLPRVAGLAEAIAINSVPWSMAFPGRPSPLARFGGGGVSGKAAQPFTWPLVRKITAAGTIPVIAPSIWDYADIAAARRLGAQAVSFGSVFLRYPWRPTKFVDNDMREGR
jgi:dihydroorotate dehydrogenase (NAD+) catalytic subunit